MKLKKIIYLLCIYNITNDLLAIDNSNFQQFDNRVSFGMQFGQGTLSNSQGYNPSAINFVSNSNNFSYNSLSIEVEKLFDVGIWLDVQIANLNNYVQDNYTPAPLGNYQYIADFKGKIGYNFQLLDNLSIKPYFLIGKSANIGSINVGSYGLNGLTGIAQDYYLNTGGGLRLEYIINKYFDIYIDQFASYNADQAPLSGSPSYPLDSVVDSSNMQYTTTLGLKVNLWQDLQLGASLFYTNYNYGQSTLDFYNQGNNDGSATGGGIATNEYGALLQIGWTFK